jgi:hypothetical protein
MNSTITEQSKWKDLLLSSQIAERIQTMEKELDDHFNNFMVGSRLGSLA